MSCRHDLALGTCVRCCPKTGKIEPGPEDSYEDNLDGSGAVPRAQAPAPDKFSPAVRQSPRLSKESVTEVELRGAMAEREVLRNVVVEVEAVMRLCFHSKFPGTPYRKPGDLKEFWYSAKTENLRKKMREEVRIVLNSWGVQHVDKIIGEIFGPGDAITGEG